MILHHYHSSSISLFALKCYTFFLLLPANTCRFHLTVSGSFTALLLELQLQHSCHENQSTRPGVVVGRRDIRLLRHKYFPEASFSRIVVVVARTPRNTALSQKKKLCMELAKYSTLPVSLSCFHSGTVCSCRLRPYSAIDAKELAGLVVASLFSVVPSQRSQTPACDLA